MWVGKKRNGSKDGWVDKWMAGDTGVYIVDSG
jgi:hypothetical protein